MEGEPVTYDNTNKKQQHKLDLNPTTQRVHGMCFSLLKH